MKAVEKWIVPVVAVSIFALLSWRSNTESEFEQGVRQQHAETHQAITDLAAGLMGYTDTKTADRYKGTDALCDWINHLAVDHGAEVPHETINDCVNSGVLVRMRGDSD